MAHFFFVERKIGRREKSEEHVVCGSKAKSDGSSVYTAGKEILCLL